MSRPCVWQKAYLSRPCNFIESVVIVVKFVADACYFSSIVRLINKLFSAIGRIRFKDSFALIVNKRKTDTCTRQKEIHDAVTELALMNGDTAIDEAARASKTTRASGLTTA